MGSHIEWCDETLNFMGVPIDGCFNCVYCYRNRLMTCYPSTFPVGPHFGRLEKLNAWQNKSVFLNSMFDICHPSISNELLHDYFKILRRTPKSNTLIHLSKNPGRYAEFITNGWLPKNVFLGLTIESDTYIYQTRTPVTDAPHPIDRIADFADLEWPHKFISIEPILMFTTNFIDHIRSIKHLSHVIIGANSTPNLKMVEPDPPDLQNLIQKLRKHYTLILKKNIKRLGISPDYRILQIESQEATLNAWF